MNIWVCICVYVWAHVCMYECVCMQVWMSVWMCEFSSSSEVEKKCDNPCEGWERKHIAFKKQTAFRECNSIRITCIERMDRSQWLWQQKPVELFLINEDLASRQRWERKRKDRPKPHPWATTGQHCGRSNLETDPFLSAHTYAPKKTQQTEKCIRLMLTRTPALGKDRAIVCWLNEVWLPV